MVKLSKRELARKEIFNSLGSLEVGESYRLSDLINQYGENIVVTVDYEYDYCYCDECCNCDRYAVINIQSVRLETDAEYDCRIASIVARKNRKGA